MVSKASIRPLGPVFDKPLWKIIGTGDRIWFREKFCNEVEIGLWERPAVVTGRARILVPADLFSYIRACGWERKPIRMLLLSDKAGKFRFCVSNGQGIEWLWTYPNLPVWAEDVT